MSEKRLPCDAWELLIQDYLDGYLLGPDRADLEGHLARCSACREELLRMKELEARLDQDPPVEVPPHLAASILGKLPAGEYRRPWLSGPTPWVGLAFAAVITLFLAIYPGRGPIDADPSLREVEIVFYAPEARSVNLAGDFNGWDTRSHAMKLGPGGTWRMSLRVPPGLYQYNFYVDQGQWADNPGNQAQVNDGFGGRNALLFVEG
jgi:hypothetical protein